MNRKPLSIIACLCVLLSQPVTGVGKDENEPIGIVNLIRQLDHADFETRERATAQLKRYGAAAFPALRAARESADALELQLRLDALLHGPTVRGRSVSNWIASLLKQDGTVPDQALQALEAAGAEALPQVEALLEQPGAPGYYEALWLIYRMGPQAASAGERLRAQLTGELLAVHAAPAKDGAGLYIFLKPYRYFEGFEPALDYRIHARERVALRSFERAFDWVRMAASQRPVDLRIMLQAEPAADELPSLLYGVMRLSAHARASRLHGFEVPADLRLDLLGLVLARVGAGQVSAELAGRARMAVAAMRHGPDGR